MKKLIVTLTLLSILGAGGYFWYTKYLTPKNTRTFWGVQITVSTGSIQNIVKATGKVYPVQESNLTFTRQWTITAIYKKIGDHIKAGDLVAELDAKTAKLDVASARISLSNAENNLKKIMSSATEVDKIRAQNTLEDSKSRLILLEKQYEDLQNSTKTDAINSEANIKSLEDKVALAKSDLEYTRANIVSNTTTNNLERDITNTYSQIESAYLLIIPGLQTIRDTLYLEFRSHPVYGAISENNPTLKTQIESTYQSIRTKQAKIDTVLTELRANKNNLTSVITGLTEIKSYLSEINSLTSLSISALRASKAGPELSDAMITSSVATLETLGKNLSSSLSSLSSGLATLKNYGNDTVQDLANKNSVTSKELSLSSAKNDLEKAKLAYENSKKTSASQLLSASQGIESQKNTIQLNESSYWDLLDGPLPTDVTSARNSVESARISLQKSELSLREYQLYATYDGVIKDIPWTVWDTVTTGTSTNTESISITNSGGYEIRVSLDQADIVKIRSGMDARIRLDAYANMSFSGVVSSVSPTPTESSSVVSYTAKILLPKTEKEIYTSMSATVEIIVAKKENILIIPISATRSDKWKTYVDVLGSPGPNAAITATEVQLGVSDSQNIEVLSWLTPWQKLKNQQITKSSTTTPSTSSTRSGFGGSSGMGGPPPF